MARLIASAVARWGSSRSPFQGIAVGEHATRLRADRERWGLSLPMFCQQDPMRRRSPGQTRPPEAPCYFPLTTTVIVAGGDVLPYGSLAVYVNLSSPLLKKSALG